MYSNPSNLLGGTSNVSLSGDGTTQDPFSISVTEVDGSTTNEIQTLLISGNQLSISDGNTITIAHPTLTVTKETIGYIFSALHHSGGNGNGAILYKNNIKTTGNPKTGRISAGSYTVIFNSAHPDGDNYPISLGVQEGGSRDGNIIQVVEGSQTANGFEVMILTGDNGTTADILIDSGWYFNVSATKEVVTNVTLD